MSLCFFSSYPCDCFDLLVMAISVLKFPTAELLFNTNYRIYTYLPLFLLKTCGNRKLTSHSKSVHIYTANLCSSSTLLEIYLFVIAVSDIYAPVWCETYIVHQAFRLFLHCTFCICLES